MKVTKVLSQTVDIEGDGILNRVANDTVTPVQGSAKDAKQATNIYNESLSHTKSTTTHTIKETNKGDKEKEAKEYVVSRILRQGQILQGMHYWGQNRKRRQKYPERSAAQEKNRMEKEKTRLRNMYSRSNVTKEVNGYDYEGSGGKTGWSGLAPDTVRKVEPSGAPKQLNEILASNNPTRTRPTRLHRCYEHQRFNLQSVRPALKIRQGQRINSTPDTNATIQMHFCIVSKRSQRTCKELRDTSLRLS